MSGLMTYGRLAREIMAGPITFKYWLSEVHELAEEIAALNIRGIREELSDVTCMGVLWLYAQGLPVGWIPILPGLGLHAAEKYAYRLIIWNKIFKRHGVEFHRRYLIHGGNYAKLEKVQTALRMAGCLRVDEDWLRRRQFIK